MKILLFGKNGQVGFELQRTLATLGEVKALGSKELDITNFLELRNCIRQYAPNVIVNAAAYTAVDKAETTPELAYLTNSEAITVMAEEAKLLNAWLIHYSTDYVFNGAKASPYIENDNTAPLSIYGKSKKAGEDAIIASNCKHLILRTSWVYATHGANFAKTILRLAKERDKLSIVNDQFGAPTSAELISDITALILYRIFYDPDLTVTADTDLSFQSTSGIYHLVASGKTSWYGFAVRLIEDAIAEGAELKCRADNIKPISTSDYPLPAKRPINSSLDTSKLRKKFGLTIPDWELHSKRFISTLLSN
ncbi:dTDP-4-dehydrorhamnose reductase [Candidatus Trichorickettsia mobilis]|uniref:dTDP-4-dehydrorhamnose reductase n=1 Tax=Candidatus Trichorickettsia mobilis TaxID=1346319 RepID=UPI002930E8A2|nr:dTDP-4-dehydrorhamnose reductase [Candidatus Trichorickettsia mobilis]